MDSSSRRAAAAAAALASFALAGCEATISKRLQAPLAAASAVDSPVTCQPCTTEWQRAQLWLTAHSKWKVQTATDVVLSTYSPVDADVSYGFTVTKEPLASDRYRITVRMQCGNPLGCDPLAPDVRRSFYHYVRTGDDLLIGAGYLGSIR
jgi:hypothetical protein